MLSKQLTKNGLMGINAWNEIEGWFKKIKELAD